MEDKMSYMYFRAARNSSSFMQRGGSGGNESQSNTNGTSGSFFLSGFIHSH